MSDNKWYRILAVIGVVFLLAFGVLLAFVFATWKQVYIYLSTGFGGIGLIIWLGLTIIKKDKEKREEMQKKFDDFEREKNNPDAAGIPVSAETPGSADKPETHNTPERPEK